MKDLKIAIASDHAGFSMKTSIVKWLEAQQADFNDFGTDTDASTDYPDFAHEVAGSVENGDSDIGILICGTGIGMDITANKHQGIRAALCWRTEIAKLAKSHNNANIICLPARFIETSTAIDILHTFFTTEFEAGRHLRRINKVPCG
jgi:ribose 5-phosphate isomerase B